MPTGTDAELERLLRRGELTPVGRISGSSNGALLCLVGDPADEVLVIHKPEASERRLWDYPDGTLVARERAAYLVSEAGGFGVVPPTVLRTGPLGPGSVQLWVGPTTGEAEPLVDVLEPQEVPPGWFVVLEGESPLGEPVVVAHCAEPGLRSVAVLDAALNNSDRKGGHLLRDGAAVRGCDHGVSLGVEPKLRTVLWGWAGEPLPESDLGRLERLLAALTGGLADQLEELLTTTEVQALEHRVRTLLRTRRHPVPRGGWPAIPWPAL
ncbi:SCO1664 family protein [Phycicoccus endophyticus]|uniref:SCO1664 family protein n=1 Tax=Phycicoccus endophyticus TaxID=1690220 RepID=A0A7G9R4I0_9MICO|nr:SCO1664 family protein [Phycicoccus endophyticus]NHI18391.1 SCO1664 family protein [Phycicoccus endophyticus]QNN50505.1 SCO1664 family protein [Phycicoccus endophyticus]GGL24164.1 phosphatidylinositol kinase [Phycicoccus endophyticus]